MRSVCNWRRNGFLAAVAAVSLGLLAAQAGAAAVLSRQGTPALPILSGSVEAPVQHLAALLNEITGGQFEVRPAKEGDRGIYVGLASDFPWLKVEDAAGLGAEGFILRDQDGSLLIVANGPLGVQHGVATLLRHVGYRSFFPGETWRVVPSVKDIAVSLNERQTPSFPTQRGLWYGFGANPHRARAMSAWKQDNRMGGPLQISIGHTWYGLNNNADFQTNPEWFALVSGERRQSKPCFSHPAVLERAIATVMAAAEKAGGQGMTTLSPPDGLGYCECEKCFAVFQGGTPDPELFSKYRAWFAVRPDGVLVNATSETLFDMANKVAAAVAEKYPDYLVGCYAYSAYSHPPSFSMHPNVYIQTTTHYRRTPLSLPDQLQQWGSKAVRVDIRGYWSVYQWDYDGPDPGVMKPQQMQEQLRLFHSNGVTGVNPEASDNWGTRGLGYYVAAQLLWDVDADVKALVDDFYDKAFGPAAGPMREYYEMWYNLPSRDDGGWRLAENLKRSYEILDRAVQAAEDRPDVLARVDEVRMYMRYMFLRHQGDLAVETKDPQAVARAVEAETSFGARLAANGMIHTRPLLGKAFHRRFSKHLALMGIPEAERTEYGLEFRRRPATPPTHEELNGLWAQDKAAMGWK